MAEADGALIPEQGWHCLHLFYRIEFGQWQLRDAILLAIAGDAEIQAWIAQLRSAAARAAMEWFRITA